MPVGAQAAQAGGRVPDAPSAVDMLVVSNISPARVTAMKTPLPAPWREKWLPRGIASRIVIKHPNGRAQR
jgi:hypothetical protein